MSIARVIVNNKLATLWFIFLAITFFASIFYVNPTLDPNATGIAIPQWELQFAFTPENGMNVLEGWGFGAKDRYLHVIWIDILFALSYGPFFYMLIRKLDGRLSWSLVPIAEMGTNLIETSLEIYWVKHHTSSEPMFAIFLTHSIVASIKWLILVPIYLVHSVILIRKWTRGRAASNAVGMSIQEIEQQLRDVIVEQFKVPASRLTKDTSLVRDIGADSMSLVEMTARIEDRFGVNLPNVGYLSGKSLGDLVAYLASRNPIVRQQTLGVTGKVKIS